MNGDVPESKATTGSTAGDRDGGSQSGSIAPGGRLFLTIFPSIMLPMFLSVVDQTIVATALPAIAASLGDVEQVSWVVVSYLVANCIAAPIYGRLGDGRGRRQMMLVALVVFIAASLFCAFAWNVEVLSIARLLQGLGGGGLMTLSQALIGESIPPRERPRYQGYLSTVVVFSAGFGPVAGGFLTQQFGWRSVFLINLPFGLLAFALALRLPKVVPRGDAGHFDGLGLFFFVMFVAPILLALEQVQRFDEASWPLIFALFGIAFAALLLLLRQERRTTSPLLPISLLRHPAIWRCDLLAAFHGAALVSMITYVPIYLRVARGASASEIGLMLVPLSAGIGIGSLITSRLVTRTGLTTIFPACGLIVTTALLLVVGFALPYLRLDWVPVLLGVISLCMGTTMNVVQITVQNVAGRKALGAAAGSVQFSRSVGAAFGTAGVGALLFVILLARNPRCRAHVRRDDRAGTRRPEHGAGSTENGARHGGRGVPLGLSSPGRVHRHRRRPRRINSGATALKIVHDPSVREAHMKSILIPVEDHASMNAVLETALLLARRFGSYMEGVALGPDIGEMVAADFSLSGVIFDERTRREFLDHARMQFEAFMAGTIKAPPDGVDPPTFGWMGDTLISDNGIGEYGRLFDIIAVGRPGSTTHEPRKSTLEAALFDSGRPILIAPPRPPAVLGRSISIAWNGRFDAATIILLPVCLYARACTYKAFDNDKYNIVDFFRL